MTQDTKDTNVGILRIYEQWHQTASNRDVPGTLALYAEDAVLETPLVLAIFPERDSGVLRGRAEIEEFFIEGTKRRPNELVRWYRNGTFFSNGRQLVWEYPRRAPDGDQVDILEFMDIDVESGLIQSHRIYWGWFGVRMLTEVHCGSRPQTLNCSSPSLPRRRRAALSSQRAGLRGRAACGRRAR